MWVNAHSLPRLALGGTGDYRQSSLSRFQPQMAEGRRGGAGEGEKKKRAFGAFLGRGGETRITYMN